MVSPLPGLRIFAVGSPGALMCLIKVTIRTSALITPAHRSGNDKSQRNDASDNHDYDDSCPHRHRDHQRLGHFGVLFPGVARLGRYRVWVAPLRGGLATESEPAEWFQLSQLIWLGRMDRVARASREGRWWRNSITAISNSRARWTGSGIGCRRG